MSQCLTDSQHVTLGVSKPLAQNSLLVFSSLTLTCGATLRAPMDKRQTLSSRAVLH